MTGPDSGHSGQSAVVAAERAVIGAILLRPEVFHDVQIAVDEFGDPRWRKVYGAICDAVFGGEPVESAPLAAAIATTAVLIIAIRALTL